MRKMREQEKNGPFEKCSEATFFLCALELLGHEERTDEQEDVLVFVVHSAKLLAKLSKYSFHW